MAGIQPRRPVGVQLSACFLGAWHELSGRSSAAFGRAEPPAGARHVTIRVVTCLTAQHCGFCQDFCACRWPEAPVADYFCSLAAAAELPRSCHAAAGRGLFHLEAWPCSTALCSHREKRAQSASCTAVRPTLPSQHHYLRVCWQCCRWVSFVNPDPRLFQMFGARVLSSYDSRPVPLWSRRLGMHRQLAPGSWAWSGCLV